MTRSYNVVVGNPGGQQQNQQVTLNDPVLTSFDNLNVVFTPGQPSNWTRDLDEPAGMQDTRVVQENNKFDLIFTNPIGIVASAPLVVKTGSSQPIIVGTSMQDSSFSSTTAKWNFYRGMFGKIPLFRSFSPSNPGTIKKWANDADLQQVLATPSCRRVIQSLKGSGTDSVTGNSVYTLADINAWWDQAAFPSVSSGIVVYLSWFHEPNESGSGPWDGATASARYRALWRTLCDEVHNNGPANVKTVGPIWASGNIIYSGQGSFTDWHPGVDGSGIPYLDYNGIDLYSRPYRSTAADTAAGHDGYLRLEELFDNTTSGSSPHSFWDAIDAGQLPCRSNRWIIAEIASTNVRDPIVSGTYNPADADDSRRAIFARNLYTRMSQLRNDCEAITWWAATDNGNYEYWTWAGTQADPLADPLAVAWRQNCQESAAALGW